MPSRTHEGDLNLHPFVRGFWTDEEMLEATGASSIAVIKQMQKDKLVEPSRYKTPAGKLARAWSGQDLFRIALVVDFVFHSGLNLAVSSLIIGAVGKDQIDQVLASKEAIRQIQDAYNVAVANSDTDHQGLPESWKDVRVEIFREEELEVQVVDREFLFTATPPRDSQAKHDWYPRVAMGWIDKIKTTTPKLWPSDADSSPEVATSMLKVSLHRLATRPAEYAFGLDAYIDMWMA